MAQEAETEQTKALARVEPKSEAEKAWGLANRKAIAFSRSSLVPKEYQGDAGLPNVLIAMEMAERIGASPLMVMQNLHVVQGRPSWSSTFLIACVNSCGRFTPLRFEFVGAQGRDDWACRAVAKDKATGEELGGEWITWAMAKAEGWTKKNGSKWLTMPGQMFRYRAAAFWTRIYAPEISLGMHTSDELSDSAPYMAGPVLQMGAAPAEILPGDPRALEASLRGKEAEDVEPETDDGAVVPAAREPGED